MTPPKEPPPRMPGTGESAPTFRKRPYQKPAFTREQLFETMALACGKTIGNPGNQCQRVKKTS